MLRRVWEDFAVLGWAKRNVMADAHPPGCRARAARSGRSLSSVANTLAELIIGGALASTAISDQAHEDQGATVGGDSGEAA